MKAREAKLCARRRLATAAACAFALSASTAAAQNTPLPPQKPAAAQPAPQTQSAPAAPAPQEQGFFTVFGRWIDQSVANINETLRGTRERVDDFGKDANAAARNTVDAARDAAGTVARLPYSRVVSGHERCVLAPNGAPDCIAAAIAVCKAAGFTTGKSVDMTSAEKCPVQVYLSGRKAGECVNETFVSRALCQ
jgi:hypothetical protein